MALIQQLKQENEFLNKVLKYVPASVHVLEINDKCETKVFWTTDSYVHVTGINLAQREKMGFTHPSSFYNKDDVQEILDATKHLLDGKDSKIAVVCRLNKNKDEEWVYIRGAKINLEENKHHVVIVIFSIEDEMVFNQLKLDVYLKEINRLKNQLTISKLSKTELKVIELLGQGSSTKEVANNLCRSFDTINNHRRSIFKKLEIHKISELVKFAKDNGLS